MFWTSQNFHVPERTAFRVLALMKKNKGLNHRQGAGAPRKIQPNDKRGISSIIKSVSRISVRQLTTRLESNDGKSTSIPKVSKFGQISPDDSSSSPNPGAAYLVWLVRLAPYHFFHCTRIVSLFYEIFYVKP